MNSPGDVIAVARRFARYPFSVNAYAQVIERFLLLGDPKPVGPQLFILGLPRSGTTLIYQYIVHRLKVAYFTNGVGTLPNAPCLATLVQNWIYGDYSSDFISHYGKVRGPAAPREAGGFWGRFFDPDNYVGYDELSKDDVTRLRKTIAIVERSFGGVPFVNKNVKHLLRIEALKKTFPDCHFLVVERDRVQVALSLLRGRYETQADPRQWLSARPPDFQTLATRTLVEQVSGQLDSLNARLEEDISKLDGRDVTRVKYGDFCKNPEELIARLRPAILDVETRSPALRQFETSRKAPRNEEEESLVRLIQGGPA